MPCLREGLVLLETLTRGRRITQYNRSSAGHAERLAWFRGAGGLVRQVYIERSSGGVRVSIWTPCLSSCCTAKLPRSACL